MLHTVHIFIGKEFEQLLSKVGAKLIKEDSTSFNFINVFIADDSSGSQLSVKQLCVTALDNDANFLFDNPMTDWHEIVEDENSDIRSVYDNQIFDKILNAQRANQLNLPVFLHFPFYKESAIKLVDKFCDVITNGSRPSDISFIGYGEDMSRFIEPDCNVETPSSAHLAEFRKIREAYNLNTGTNRFVFIHNSTPQGIALGIDPLGQSFAEMIQSLLTLLSSHFEDMIPIEVHDVTALGFSSLKFDKYAFASYLLKKTTLHTMDKACVNKKDIDINDVCSTINELFRDKERILSDFLANNSDYTNHSACDPIFQKIDHLREAVDRECANRSDLSFKAVLLAVLLQKTENELFSSSILNTNNSCLIDLYSESIEYFITHDKAEYFKIKDEKIENPITKIKEINRTIMNSESQVRDLEHRIEEQRKHMDNADKVQHCLIEDNCILIEKNKYQLLPSIDELPLEETYQAKATTAESVDLRGDFTAIKNQGEQGSCLSHALVAVFEYMMKRNFSKECDLSEAFLYYNARNMDTEGDVSVNIDSGSRFKPSLDSLTKYGIALEAYCRYVENSHNTKPSDKAYKDAENRKLRKALGLRQNVNDIKSALAEGYPVVASFTLCESFVPEKGLIPMPDEEEIKKATEVQSDEHNLRHSNHAMVICGYSDKMQMFLVRNSWGEAWGDNGYCYIPYAYVAQEELFNFACIITEIEAVENAVTELKQIPALKVDNTDVRIRYLITKAELEFEHSRIKELTKERLYWIEYLEITKSLFSNTSHREEFVSENSKYYDKIISDTETEIDKNRKEQEQIKKEWLEFSKKKSKRTIINVVASFLICWLLAFTYNYFMEQYLNDKSTTALENKAKMEANHPLVDENIEDYETQIAQLDEDIASIDEKIANTENQIEEIHNQGFQAVDATLTYQLQIYNDNKQSKLSEKDNITEKLSEELNVKNNIDSYDNTIKDISDKLNPDSEQYALLKFFDWIWIPFVYSIICVLILLYVLHRRKKEWIEQRDYLQILIDKGVKQIIECKEQKEKLNLHSFTAQKLIIKIGEWESSLMAVYNNTISLINNLRTWYGEIEKSISEEKLESHFPNVELVDKPLLDAYFENTIKGQNVCDVNLCQSLEKYEITTEFLSQFKKDLNIEILTSLINHLDNKEFNISQHIVSDDFTGVAKAVDGQILEALNRQAGPFVHQHLALRGNVIPSIYIFTYDQASNDNALRNKLSSIDYSNIFSTENRYAMTLVKVMALQYDECRLLKSN